MAIICFLIFMQLSSFNNFDKFVTKEIFIFEMHTLKKFFVFIGVVTFLLSPVLSKGQNSPKQDFIITTNGHAGYIIAHRNNMANLIKGHIYGVELNYIFRTNGCKTWHQFYKYPELGFCFLHLYLGNPQQLGNLEALYPYTNIRLNKLTK